MHRLHHLNKKHNVQNVPAQQETINNNQNNQGPVSTMNFQNVNQIKKNQENAKMPRPIFPPKDIIETFDKVGFKKGLPTYPPPQMLYSFDNNYDASPQFIRPTSAILYNVPKKSIYPVAAWITPFGSEQVHVVDVNTPLRCHRCKAYVNPYFKFDGSRRSVVCNICGMKFQIQQTIDRANLQNTQLSTKGVYDFRVKDKFYYRKRTDIIKIVICIEMSQPMIELGIFNTIIESVRSAIQNSQFEGKIKLSIVYYNQDGITFLKLKRGEHWNQSPPSEYVVKASPNAAYCCPLSDRELMLDPNGQKQKLIFLLDHITGQADNYYKKGKHSNTANYVSAIKCLKQSFQNETGRIILFSCLDPRSGDKHSIRPRNQQQNKQPLKPIHSEFFQLSKELLKARVGIQHFVFTKDNMISHELATTHYLATITGAPLKLYSGYQHQNHSENLYYSIYKTLTKFYAYDCDYTCRISNGLNINAFASNVGIKETRDIAQSCMDSSSSLGVIFQHQQKIQQSYGAFIQFAMMYTNGNGQRRIRVINYRYLVSQKLESMYESVDYLSFANIMSRIYVNKLINNEPTKVRQEFMSKLTNILAEYRYKCNVNSGKYSDLVAPPNLKIGLAYIHSILNSKLFLNSLKMPNDYKMSEILRINTYDFYSFAMRFYPKVYPLTMDIYESQPLPGDFIQTQNEEDEQIAILPQNLPLTKNSIKDNGLYLQNTGEYLIMMIMTNADQQLLTEVFGTADWQQIEQNGLPELQTSHNIRIHNIINQLRRRSTVNNGIYLPLCIKTPMKKGPFHDLVMNILKQDYPECTYYSFLDTLHRQVQVLSK